MRDVAASRQGNPPRTLRNRHHIATETALNTAGIHIRCISPKTVRNRLRESGLHARPPYVGPPLTQARRLHRMVWLTARAPRRFPVRQFHGDESFLRTSLASLFFARLFDVVYCIPMSRGTLRRPLERDRFEGCAIMVWGGIAHGVKITVDCCRGQYDSSMV